MTIEILKFIKAIVEPLADKQLINSFAFGQWGEFDHNPNRNYPCCYVEFPDAYERPSSNSFDYYNVAIVLLDQPQTTSGSSLINHAQLKSKLELTWLTIWESFKQHAYGDMPDLPRQNIWVDIDSMYNAIAVEYIKADGVWGYRYEIKVACVYDGCDVLDLMTELANFAETCL